MQCNQVKCGDCPHFDELNSLCQAIYGRFWNDLTGEEEVCAWAISNRTFCDGCEIEKCPYEKDGDSDEK
jgi:hypothetical protein